MKMPRSGQLQWLLLVSAGLVLVLCTPDDLFARAGGGGSGGGGGRGGLIKLAVLILYGLYAAILWWFISRRETEANRLLEKLEGVEKSWGRDALRERIKAVYFKVQEAWAARDQSLARTYVSERLFELHQQKTGAMRARNEKNVLEQIRLNNIQIVEVVDFLDDSKDRLWVVMHGEMIDYIVDDRTNEVLRGDKSKLGKFKELWKFVRGPNEWVLDEIDQDVELADLMGFKSLKES